MKQHFRDYQNAFTCYNQVYLDFGVIEFERQQSDQQSIEMFDGYQNQIDVDSIYRKPNQEDFSTQMSSVSEFSSNTAPLKKVRITPDSKYQSTSPESNSPKIGPFQFTERIEREVLIVSAIMDSTTATEGKVTAGRGQ